MIFFKSKEKHRLANANGEINQIKEMLENLSWAADHLFSPQFCDRYHKMELTNQELLNLVDAFTEHTKNMQISRRSHELDLKKRDIRVLEGLSALRNFISK
jgi:hypothetical protein